MFIDKEEYKKNSRKLMAFLEGLNLSNLEIELLLHNMLDFINARTSVRMSEERKIAGKPIPKSSLEAS